MTLAEVMEAALQLSPEDQAILAAQLVDTFGDGGEGCTREEYEAAWGEVLRSRMASMDSGEAVMRDWREAMADIRARLHRKWQS